MNTLKHTHWGIGEGREEDVVIVGAGIAGLATALALKRVGVGSLVLERSEVLRATGAALTLFPNAWRALDALGVAHKLTPFYTPFHKEYVTDVRTGAIREISLGDANRDEGKPRAVDRKALLESLAGELPPNAIRFSSKLASLDTQLQQDGSAISILHLEDGTILRAKVLIGCDGVQSAVARKLGLSDAVRSGRSAVRGLAEYPQGHGLSHEIQLFVDVGKRGGFLPISDKTIYWFMTCKDIVAGEKMGQIFGSPELIQREVLDNLAKDFPPIYREVVQHCDLASLTWAPLMLRVPWNVAFGRLSHGCVTVAGDAMHPMTPELGQGGCSALEDAVVLGRHIGQSVIANCGKLVTKDVAQALAGYTKERKWRVSGLIVGAYLSGWAQQSRSGWWMVFLRDIVFYKFVFRFMAGHINYDCGNLPKSPHEKMYQDKLD